ncbi:MAG: type II secretion system GspH family protein [Verrucomicrobiae bacterium]|nr:type II secretion system GspH family protein [Verrucomicrobiae bacterium]NNJ43427.1 type II secretion system protein [Akkermansiaceae bacterium]
MICISFFISKLGSCAILGAEMLKNTCCHIKKTRCDHGLTLIEITVVISVLLSLLGISMYVSTGYSDWKLGSEASQKLRMVYNAQRTYLAEHPTESPSSLTAAKVIPYLSDNSPSLPTVESLDGDDLSIKVTVSPPVVVDGGSNYDPSGDTEDGLWDVGM